MRRRRGCTFLPPHILRNIAERGDADVRLAAQLALEQSAALRGERYALSQVYTLLAVPTGEKRRTIYDARHTRELPGKRVRGEGDPASKDPAVNEAYDAAGKTYDFYRRVLHRNSIDDRGYRLDLTVHYGVRYANALWNGRQIVCGDGDDRYFTRFTKSLDVIAHELTHGVTQYTAGLTYEDQSGALNEHFSDVFGVLTKQYAAKQTAARADWLIGADLFTSKVNGEAVRSMKAPGTAYDDAVLGKDPQPGHMSAYVETQFDNGGVHINSGIPNRAFYELATMIGGKAWEVAGSIWYRTLTEKLHMHATFEDCANATWEAAGELYGERSAPQQAVLAAWQAVGIAIAGPRMLIRTADAYQPPAGAAEVPISVPPLRAPSRTG
jgi:Zn-dependent metalloprotease